MPLAIAIADQECEHGYLVLFSLAVPVHLDSVLRAIAPSAASSSWCFSKENDHVHEGYLCVMGASDLCLHLHRMLCG